MTQTPSYKKPETIYVPVGTTSVSCDGGKGALGHPVVYYSLDNTDKVTCGYCDREFVIKA